MSAEDADYAYRAELLRQVPAAIRFLSVEPLLGPVPALPLAGIHWVIVGDESGPGASAVHHEWVESIYHQCRAGGVPFFFKQWGGVHKFRRGREFHGTTFNELPTPPTAHNRNLPPRP